jgi:hypothetical protein
LDYSFIISDANPSSLSEAYWIAFGPHGPRALPPPDEGKKVALYTLLGVGVSFVAFIALRVFAKPAPHTMNREWQEAANEYLKVSKDLMAKAICVPLALY